MLPLFQSGRGDSMKPYKGRSAFFFKKTDNAAGETHSVVCVLDDMVEPKGLEPSTSALRTRRSPS